MWLNPDVHEAIEIPQHLYPAFAPLPVPFAQHLVTQEYRKQWSIVRRKRSTPEKVASSDLWQTILTRVREKRSVIFDLMHPFVLADAQKPRRGRDLSFPDSEWILDILANLTPPEHEPKNLTARNLETWVERGLLTREWVHGPFDRTSVCAFLLARAVEEVYKKKWLPSNLASDVPRWWCYGQASPDAEIVSVPVPLPDDLPASMILWTPWYGSVWQDDAWRVIGPVACRWSFAHPSEDALAVWDKEIVAEIRNALHSIPFGKEAVYAILLLEARKVILERRIFPLEKKKL